MDEQFLRQAELHLRLHLHALVPLHEGVVEALRRFKIPLELATTLEDIGQRYLKMAESLNREIIDRNMIDAEPEEAEDFADAKIDRFKDELFGKAGVIVFHDGMRVDGATALEATPVVADAINAAILIARSQREGVRPMNIMAGKPPTQGKSTR